MNSAFDFKQKSVFDFDNSQGVPEVKNFFNNVGEFATNAWNKFTDFINASGEYEKNPWSPVNIVNGIGSGANDFFTGDRTFDRDLYINNLNNAFNAEEAEKARQFQKELAQNEYSYKIADLKKNGINPYYALGGGAVVPSAYGASSSGGHNSSNSSGIGSLLTMLFGSAFKAAQAANKPADYTDTYVDRDGVITGYRTRSY